jgi:ADP-heptose:LPS heptosyltransferase
MMKAALRRALPVVAAIAGRVVRREPDTPIPLPDRPKILLLQLQQVGDSMGVSPLLRALHQRYPDMLLDILASPAAKAVHRKSPHIHAMVTAPRTVRYDCVLACVNQVSFRYALIAASTRARRRIGFDVEGAGFLFTRRLAVPKGVNVLNANMLLAAAVDADATNPVEEFWFDDADRAAAARLAPEQPYVVIHPGSNWQSKTWYADRWAAVADALAPLVPVFVGTPADAPLVDEIRRGVSLVGQTDLCQLGALMERAELCITTDSGPRHIAGALGRPLVTIMSSLDEPYRWTFDRPHEIVLRTDPPCAACLLSYCSHRTCMDRLTVDAVLSACARARSHSQLPTHVA